jgi:protein CpxP
MANVWAGTAHAPTVHSRTLRATKIHLRFEEYRVMNDFNYGYLLAKRALLLAGVFAVACCTLWAQSDGAPPEGPPPGGMHRGGPNPERQLQELTRVLSLSTDQQTQVKAILAEQRSRMEEMRQSSASDDANAAPPNRQQMEAVRNETDSKINALLNDDQKPKYAAWQQQRKERMQHRGGGDGPPPPAPGSGV